MENKNKKFYTMDNIKYLLDCECSLIGYRTNETDFGQVITIYEFVRKNKQGEYYSIPISAYDLLTQNIANSKSFNEKWLEL